MLNDERLDDLRRWIRERRTMHCVSVYMPVQPNGPAVRENPIRLRNLLDEAARRLTARGATSEEIDSTLAPARALVGDEERWKHSQPGLALLLGGGDMRRYDSRKPFAEAVRVTDAPYIKPLLGDRVPDDHFYVLTLGRQDVALYEGDLDGLRRVDAPAIPSRIEEGLGREEQWKTLQHHSVRGPGPGGSTIFHGQGVGSDEANDELRRFFRVVDRGLREAIDDPTLPVVLAGVQRSVATFRRISRYPTLVRTSIAAGSEAALYDAAWTAVLPHLRAKELEARRRFRRLHGTGRTTTDLGDVLGAAADGRIETLFAVTDDDRCGCFDPRTRTLRLGDLPDAVDLVELAVERALEQHAEVFTAPRHLVPGGGLVAATYRY